MPDSHFGITAYSRRLNESKSDDCGASQGSKENGRCGSCRVTTQRQAFGYSKCDLDTVLPPEAALVAIGGLELKLPSRKASMRLFRRNSSLNQST